MNNYWIIYYTKAGSEAPKYIGSIYKSSTSDYESDQDAIRFDSEELATMTAGFLKRRDHENKSWFVKAYTFDTEVKAL